MGKETISRKTIAKSVVSGVVALASLGALQVGEYKLPSETAETEATATADAVTESGSAAEDAGSETVSYSNGFTPGTYTASAKGMESDVTAVCTFDETSLTAVELDVSGETQGIGAAAGEDLTSAFLAAQSPEIDGVSGASVTSTAAKTAVSDCFAQAAVDSASEDGEAESADETGAAETEAAETEADASTETAEEANANATGAAGAYTPGTYTASSKGLESDVTAICTFDETGLTAISLDVSGETPDIGGAIGEEMTAAILNAQSAEVDGVSGATVTSTAVKDAVSECFALAAGGSNAEAASSEETKETTEAAAEGETESAAESETEAAAESETEAADDSSAAEGEETEAVEATATAGAYTFGTYTASAAGISSDVTVTITIDDSKITGMTVDVSGETAGIGADIGDTIIEQVLTAQSAEVDGVSGATVTSTAVKTAVSECLAQAAGGSDAEAADTEETEEATEAAAESETEAAEEAETEAAEENETESAAEVETEVAAAGAYTPGTYTASAAGLESDVTAVCTFNEAGLTAISLDVSGETPDIGGAIGEEMSSAILTAQSAEVDGVSGATVTSTAVKAAVSECFAQATGGSNAETADSEEAEETTETATEDETESAAEAETEAVAEAETDTVELTAAAGVYTPGTYTASASSSTGDVTAFCTFNETSLIAIGLDVPGGIADALSRSILHAQSAEVDSISGAPEASAAVMEAVQSCFDQAAGN